jgi:hypothetical protein
MCTRLLLCALLCTGCDEILSTTLAVSVITRTPELASAANEVIPATALGPLNQMATAIVCGVGQREDSTSTETPTPVTGAQVSVSFSTSIQLCEIPDSQGTYGASSIPTEDCGDERLVYTDNTEYTTEISLGGDMYSVSVIAPPGHREQQRRLQPGANGGVGSAGHRPARARAR